MKNHACSWRWRRSPLREALIVIVPLHCRVGQPIRTPRILPPLFLPTRRVHLRAILLNRLKLFIYRQVSLKLREKSGCLSIELAGGRSALLPENERVIWVACLFRMVLVGHAVIFFNQALDSRLELLLFGDALVQIFNQVHQTGRRKVFVLLAIGVDAPEFVHLLFGKRMCEVGPPLTKVAKSKASQRTVLISWGMPCALVIE